MIFFLILLPFVSVAISLPPLGVGEFADTEVTTNVVFEAAGRDELRLKVECEGSASNNVQVALGRDTNENCILDLEEIELIFGWDSGAWRMASKADSHPIRLQGGCHSAELRVRTKTKVGAVYFSDGSHQILPAQAWHFSPEWNMLRATKRGYNSTPEAISVRAITDPVTILIR